MDPSGGGPLMLRMVELLFWEDGMAGRGFYGWFDQLEQDLSIVNVSGGVTLGELLMCGGCDRWIRC